MPRNPFDLKDEHDLRTPLTIIRGYLEMLESGDIQLDACLPALRRASDELEQNIDRLLTRWDT